MVEEEKKMIRGSSCNMMVGTATGTGTGTGTGFDHPNSYHVVNNSSSTTNNINPINDFFNFEQHMSHNNSSDLFWKQPSSNSPSSSKPIMITGTGTGEFCQFAAADESISSLHQQQRSSSSSCVLIPCEPNERPSHGLSLSLSSTNPSTIQIQPFELVRPQNHHHHQGYFGKPINMQHDMIMTTDDDIDQDEFLRKSSGAGGAQHHQISYNIIRSSRYLTPAQQLLNEFCNLGTNHSTKAKAIIRSTNQYCWQQDHDINATSNSKVKPALNTLEFLELQKRKSMLLQMLDEVDIKYHNYCGQMKAVVSSFEAVAGRGAATVYSALASKAMSRHFRCLRDGIVGQIKATKKAMGEKDISAPGATRGETPRLRLLDQTLRQQRAFQQMTMMDSHPWRPQRGLPERSVSILRAWLFEHFLHPYPSDVDKHILARQTGLSRSQVSNWFINARVRLWKPMVEEMYVEETKDNDHENIDQGVSDRFNAAINDENTTLIPQMEQKPTVDQLIRRDSDCLSSIINHHDHHTTKIIDHDIHQSFARVSADPFGAVELDFSAYNHNFGGSTGGGGVSLTLGLQQHADGSGGGGGDDSGVGGGVSLYYPRDHMEDCQNSVQYSSLLEGDQGENLPYRNLMGAQLLHDLAG